MSSATRIGTGKNSRSWTENSTSVFWTAFQKAGSSNIRWKLSRPTKGLLRIDTTPLSLTYGS